MIRAIYDRIIIKPDEKEKQSQLGLIIPDTAQEKIYTGTVISAGPGKKTEAGDFIKLNVKTGDRVYYEKHGLVELMYNNERYLVTKEFKIIAIIENEKIHTLA